jgi:hypothetical protein
VPYGQLFDSTDVDAIPRDARQVAGYVDGAYRTWPELVKRFPLADHLSITVAGNVTADCADVEDGAMTPGQVAIWVGRKLHLRTRPRIYTSLDNWPTVIDALAAAHVPGGTVWWWIAEWTGHAHEINGAQCVQYASPGYGLPEDHHYDVSEVFTDRFVPSKRA